MKKFWNWIRDEDGGRVLRLEGPIDSESFWGDEVTPRAFRDDLYAEEGDITLWINSPGGNVFAAAEIYTMIRDYPGNVTVRIASIAASAASVVAMSGDTVQVSPTAVIMIHDPMTIAMGNAKDMEKAITTLNEVKQSIINAYAAKTGLSRNRISRLMENETWMNAKKAVEYGFADEILFEWKKPDPPDEDQEDGVGTGSDGSETPEKDGDGEGGGKDGSDNGKDDGGSKKKKGISLASGSADLWETEPSLFSTRIMCETILNRLGCFTDTAEAETQITAAQPPAAEPVGDAPADSPVEDTPVGDTPVESSTDAASDDARTVDTEAADGVMQEAVDTQAVEALADVPADTPAEVPLADIPPVIGLDGKTQDGAMPFEILKNQLDLLK